ncbi:hypothetical protein JCM11251_004718 [Rhodosporidiobolus azoricus]
MEPQAAAAALAAAVNAALDGVLMPIVVGCFLSCVVLGLLLAASVQYFSSFPQDRWQYKVLVGVLTVVSPADTANSCAWAYHYAIDSYMTPLQLADWPIYFTIYGAFTGTTILLCQVFFIWRGWIVAGRDKYLFTACQLAVAIGAAGESSSFFWPKSVLTLLSLVLHSNVAYAWLAIGLGVHDLCRRLKRLAILSVKTNAASLVVQLAVLLTMVLKPTFHYSIIGLNETKVYSISVILTLNARNSTGHDSSTSYDATSAPAPTRVRGFGAGASSFCKPLSGASPPQAIVHVHRSVRISEGDRLESQVHLPQQQFAPDEDKSASYAMFVLENDSKVVAEGDRGSAGTSEKRMSRAAAF